MFSSFPSAEILKSIQAHSEAFTEAQAFDKTTFEGKVAPLIEVVTKYEHSLKYVHLFCICTLLSIFVDDSEVLMLN